MLQWFFEISGLAFHLERENRKKSPMFPVVFGTLDVVAKSAPIKFEGTGVGYFGGDSVAAKKLLGVQRGVWACQLRPGPRARSGFFGLQRRVQLRIVNEARPIEPERLHLAF